MVEARLPQLNRHPVIIFLIQRGGFIFDGTHWAEAVATIGGQVNPKPAFYMVNCVQPHTVIAGRVETPHPRAETH